MAKNRQAAQAAPKTEGEVNSPEGFDVSAPATPEAVQGEQAGAESQLAGSPEVATPATADVWNQNDARVAEDLKRQAENNPPVPEVAEAKAQDPIALAKAELEARLAKCANHIAVVALEKEIEACKATTKLEARIKTTLLKRAGEYRFAMQQGTPVPVIQADEIAVHPGFHNPSIRANRIKRESLSNRDLASVLAENEALKQQLASK